MLTLDRAQYTRVPNPNLRSARTSPAISLFDLLIMEIGILELDYRAHRILKETNRTFVYQLAQLNPKGADRPWGFGSVCVGRVARTLKAFGLGFNMKFDPFLTEEIERRITERIALHGPEGARMSLEEIKVEDARLLERRAEVEAHLLSIDAMRNALGTEIVGLPTPLPPRAQKAYDKMRKRMGH